MCSLISTNWLFKQPPEILRFLYLNAGKTLEIVSWPESAAMFTYIHLACPLDIYEYMHFFLWIILESFGNLGNIFYEK